MISPECLIRAYSQGVFPMAEDGEIFWFSPPIRGIIPLDAQLHIPRGLKKSLKKKPYEIRYDTAFREVMLGCSERESTWIDSVILDSYCKLHELGYAHSVECWDTEGLQGGLYGVSIARAFFGESMFSRKTDASKIALVHLVERLRAAQFSLLDTQWMTDHLRTLGGMEITKIEYEKRLREALKPL